VVGFNRVYTLDFVQPLSNAAKQEEKIPPQTAVEGLALGRELGRKEGCPLGTALGCKDRTRTKMLWRDEKSPLFG